MSDNAVKLVFKTHEDKSAFIGGLLDGWGEGGPFDVTWDHGATDEDGRCSIPADDADVLFVEMFEDA